MLRGATKMLKNTKIILVEILDEKKIIMKNIKKFVIFLVFWI